MNRAIVITAAVVLFVALPVTATTTLSDAWLRVQQVLDDPESGNLEERVQEILVAAAEVDARRLSTYAEALVAWASENPGERGFQALAMARRLDPDLPSAPFLEARMKWASGSYFGAVASYFDGWIHAVRAVESRRVLLASAAIWCLIAVGVALLTAIVLTTVRFLRLLVHDSYELGLVLFQQTNAAVFSVVVLTLPLFAGLGPVWLIAYLFVLCWAYMSVVHRLVAGLTCLLLLLLAPTAELWQSATLRAAPVGERVVRMLEYRRIDPSTLREFADLEPNLASNARFHLVLGELLRLHGDHERASVQFRKAAVIEPQNAEVLIFRGNMAAESGDMGRAIQQYLAAVELDPGNVIGHNNLSFALDQMSRFQEADAARARVQQLLPDGMRVTDLGVRGAQPRIRYPRLGAQNVAALLSEMTEQTRTVLNLATQPRTLWAYFRTPMALVFLVTGLLGVVLLIVRSKLMWTAQRCVKCGKTFCIRCKSSTESSSYCSQCISVFLKRDKVAIDQQQAKLDQIRRRDVLSATLRRVVAVLLPGGGLVLGGRLHEGLLLGMGAWFFLIGLVVWAPKFMPSVEPQSAILPVQILFGLLFGGFWFFSVVLTWQRR